MLSVVSLYFSEPFYEIPSSLKDGSGINALSFINNDSVISINSAYCLCRLIPTYSVLKFCSINYQERTMKFRILTSNQRRRERVFDMCLVMSYIGWLLKSVTEAHLLQMVGSLGLLWACLSWLMQKIEIDKLWFHIAATVILLVWMYLAAILFIP